MSAITTQPETQPGRKLCVTVNSDDEAAFTVEIEHGDWWALREITVTDPTVDLADLMRRIAKPREYKCKNGIRSNCDAVTHPDCPDGDVYYFENRRRYNVARWNTYRSLHRWTHPPDVIIAIPTIDFEATMKSSASEKSSSDKWKTTGVEIDDLNQLDDLIVERAKRYADFNALFNLFFPKA